MSLMGGDALPAAVLLAGPAAAALWCQVSRPASFYAAQAKAEAKTATDTSQGFEGFSGATAAAVTTAAWLGGAYALTEAPTTYLGGVSDRVEYALGWQAVSLLPLAGAASRLLMKRAESKDRDVQAGRSVKGVEGEARVLSETAAATALVAPATVALSLALSPEEMQLIPAISTLFVAGRVLHAHAVLNGGNSASVRYAVNFGWGLSVLPAAAAVVALSVRSLL